MPDEPSQSFPPENPSPAPPRLWSDKQDIRVPGAGTFGMGILLLSLSMIFAATMLLYVIFRYGKLGNQSWQATAPLQLPRSLWISTAIIVISSATIQYAVRAVRRDDERGVVGGLAFTLGLGAIFLLLQSFNWYEVHAQLILREAPHSFQAAFFYVLTALHAAHVVGGLIPIAITMGKAMRGAYSRNFYPGVRYCAIYWHFLAVVWVIMFVLMYLT